MPGPTESSFACNPFAVVSEDDPRCGCVLKEVVTREEEEILAKMREIKEDVRPVANKLRDVQASMGKTGQGEPSSEFARSYEQIEELRREWKEWERKLEEAIERKMIMLGHRPPA
jgi:vacuolar-type H+-ATPase subunit I/STV1